ncbi:hypothetical protein E3N88_40956 [Mikania micrantha]|uniref:Serine-threonine/tyrosine-protein kinase catalytic domain-containing protein n=1 Tax=Mikania micrantha TaxID=192012 RepID=A0A5N6LP69_9ASTR|nr:hypothetical protein E3N88_40956 [Mikania micrantha]
MSVPNVAESSSSESPQLCRQFTSIDEEQWALAIWAQDSIKEGRLKQIVDTNIRGLVSPKCVKMFAQLAKRCLHKHLKQRPTMAEVVVERNWLEGTLSNIIDPRIDVHLSSLTSFVEIGLCVQEDAVDRPTMEEVVSMLLDRASLALPVAKMREMMTTKRGCSNGISSAVNDNDSHDNYYTGADEDDFYQN